MSTVVALPINIYAEETRALQGSKHLHVQVS
jgi:hypothetical protein